MPTAARALNRLALMIVVLGQAIAAAPGTGAAATMLLPIIGFGGTTYPSVLFVDLATTRTATAFYYYKGEPPNDIAAGPLPYSRSGSIVRIDGLLNPSGDPRDVGRMQWRGSADLASGAIDLSGVDPAAGYSVTIVTSAAAGSVSQAGMIATLGFVVYTMRRWDLAYLLAGEHARIDGAAGYASRMAALLIPSALRGWSPQLGAQGLTILIQGSAATVQGNLYYSQSTKQGYRFRALTCRQRLAFEQHGWRLESLSCSAPIDLP
jgi:hypothetical protein